jgi:hypothetical protein
MYLGGGGKGKGNRNARDVMLCQVGSRDIVGRACFDQRGSSSWKGDRGKGGRLTDGRVAQKLLPYRARGELREREWERKRKKNKIKIKSQRLT